MTVITIIKITINRLIATFQGAIQIWKKDVDLDFSWSYLRDRWYLIILNRACKIYSTKKISLESHNIQYRSMIVLLVIKRLFKNFGLQTCVRSKYY